MEASRTAILAGQMAWSRAMRMDASPGLIPAAITLTSTWPGPGTGLPPRRHYRRTRRISQPAALLAPFSDDAGADRAWVEFIPAWQLRTRRDNDVQNALASQRLTFRSAATLDPREPSFCAASPVCTSSVSAIDTIADHQDGYSRRQGGSSAA
jgi:hypothetical protein